MGGRLETEIIDPKILKENDVYHLRKSEYIDNLEFANISYIIHYFFSLAIGY